MSEPRERVPLPIDDADVDTRLDAFVAARLPWRSRGSVAALIAEGAVHVNGQPAKKSRRIRTGDEVVVLVAPVDVAAELADLDVPVLFEDDDLVVVDKPPDLAVHAASTCRHRNLLTWLSHRRLPPGTVRGEPLLVHRLDRTTSGVVVAVKRRELVAPYTGQFERRETDKRYLALVHGVPTEDEGCIELALRVVDGQPVAVDPAGKPSRTDWRCVARGDGFARLAIALHTGRKHQIRVHLSAVGHPIVGDHAYGPPRPPGVTGGPYLHAAALTLMHDGQRRTFHAPVPAAWDDVWRALAATGAG